MSDNKGANRLYLLLVVVFIAAGIIFGSRALRELPIYVSIVAGQLVILIPALLYCRRRKIAITRFIPYRKISFSTGVLVVVSTYLMYPLLIVLNAITLLFSKSAVVEMQNEMLDIGIVVSTLLIAVLPVFVEEFVFRGVLFQTYRQSRIFSATILSSFLFGCMHMNFNQFLYTFVLGIYMAFLVEGTGSIISSMLAHFTLNFTSVAVSAFMKALYGSRQMEAAMQQTGDFLQGDIQSVVLMLMTIAVWFVIAIGTVSGAIAIYIQICKMNGRWEHMKTIFQKKNEEKFITVPLILAVLIVGVEIVHSIIR